MHQIRNRFAMFNANYVELQEKQND
jgi:hypothetical protein